MRWPWPPTLGLSIAIAIRLYNPNLSTQVGYGKCLSNKNRFLSFLFNFPTSIDVAIAFLLLLLLSAMDVDGKSIDRCSSRKHQGNNNIVVGTDFLETNKADRAMWLLKCPQAVTRALSNSPDAPSRPVAKVIVSVDPLQSNDDDDSSSTEVYDDVLLWCFWFWIEGSLLTALCDFLCFLLASACFPF